MKPAQLFFVLVIGVFTDGKIHAQNVGIGTTTPTEKLEVNGNILLPLQKNFYFGGRPDLGESGSRIFRSAFSQNLVFENKGGGYSFSTYDGVQPISRLNIKGSNGYVGLGNDPIERLHVEGNVFLPFLKSYYIGGRTDLGEPGTRIHYNGLNTYIDSKGGDIYFRADNSTAVAVRMKISQSTGNIDIPGNVIIGNVPSLEKLRVEGNVLLSNQNSYYIGGRSDQGENGTRLHYNINNTYLDNKGGNIYFRADNGDGSTPRMMIHGTNGNVGIGTTNPSATLDVNGSAKVGGNMDVSGNTVITGNLGIGAIVPSANLDVAGTAKITGNTSIQFGNLGVGTTSPSHKLDVIGSIRTSYSGTYVTPAPLAANSDYLIPIDIWYNPLPTGSNFTNTLLYVSPSDGARVMITQAKVVNETTLNITVRTIEAGLVRLNWVIFKL